MFSQTSFLKRALFRLLTMAAVLTLGGLAAATLVRYAPGYGVDIRELDSRLNSESIQVLRHSHSDEPVVAFYVKFLSNIIHGRFGTSLTFEQPIAQLLEQRWSVSARSLAYALTMSWFVVALCVCWVATENVVADQISSAFTGLLLSIPMAMTAFFVGSRGKKAGFALVIVLVPTVFRYARNIVRSGQNQPFIVAARARGVGSTRLLVRHVLPCAAPHLLELAGVSVSLAMGALIPIEFLCDSPGVGQLALQAALGRDLPLLVILTIVVTVITLGSNLTTDLLAAALMPGRL